MPANGDSSYSISTTWAKGANVKKIALTLTADSGDGSFPANIHIPVEGFLQRAMVVDGAISPGVITWHSDDNGYDIFAPSVDGGASPYNNVWSDPNYVFGDIVVSPVADSPVNSGVVTLTLIAYK